MRARETVVVDYEMLAAMISDLIRLKAKEHPQSARYFASHQIIEDTIIALTAVRIEALN